jgi:hypothetical protein
MQNLSLKPLLYTFVTVIICSSSINTQITKPVGINLAGVKDWSEEFVFVDIMNQSRDWIFHDLAPGSDWQSDVEIPVRPDGYPIEIPYNNGIDPAQSARTLFYFGDLENIYPEGNYRLKIDGTGQVRLWGGASGTFQCPVDTYVSVDNSSGGIALEIEQSLASDPVHNIRFIMPGFENVYETEPFHPSLLEFLEDFHVIRFMDWLETNNSTVQEWGDRNLQSNFTQTSESGVAYEYLIELSNLLQKDLWVNVPHQASDDFITQFARLLRDNVDPNLKIYLEYSNEVWNGIFSQYTYAGDQGLALGFDGEPWERAWTYTAKRSADVFHIFENEFADHERFVKVLPGFAVSSYINNFIVDRFNEIEFNPNQITADALAIAPYFGGAVADDLAEAGLSQSATVSQLLDLLEQSLPESYVWMDESKAIADANGLDLIAYEGGQHLVANYPHNSNPVFVDKLLEANRDPRMQDFYCEYMDYWYSTIGGGMFAHFSSHGGYSQFGSWGVKETYQDVNSPKYQALINCVFSENENATGASAHVLLSNDCIQLLPDAEQDVFTVEGVLADYDINIYDRDDNLIEEYGSPQGDLSIDLTALPVGQHYISIEHLSNVDLSFQQIISQ